MSNNKINSIDLKGLLSRFFDKDFEISERMLLISERFLFGGSKPADTANNIELQNTLSYLKNVMERNNFTTLPELIGYYETKRKKMNNLFEKLAEVDPEECLALDFHEACTMYMKTVKEEHKYKSDCLYYLQNSNTCCAVEFRIEKQSTSPIAVPYSPLYVEKVFMSQVKGNLLLSHGKKSCISKDEFNAVISN